MGIDCYDKVVLEPSAGKGDIIDFCMDAGAKEILSCEINEQLAKIVKSKSVFIESNFFNVTAEQVSHVELIVMNPPFDYASRHILHAWEIAPEGCEIIALCNWQTVENACGYSRTELNSIIMQYGSKENLGDCFSDAERKTDVEVGLIHLFKPIVSKSFDYDGFFYTDTEQQQQQYNGVMQYNDIRAIVNTYVMAVKQFEEVEAIGKELTNITSKVGFGYGVVFKGSSSRDESELINKEQFSKALQKHCWRRVFNIMDIEKMVTKGVLKDINKFIENRLAYPFTMRNIFRMIEIIIGTRHQIMERAIVEAVDNFTRYTHENRFGVEGWKTNEGHLLNKKFIVEDVSNLSYEGGLKIKSYGSHKVDALNDLNKALCYITGKGEIMNIEMSTDKGMKPNKWYEWGFFDFKIFLKGTGHFKFKDEKVWEMLNIAYANAKGQVLPERVKQTK